MIKHKRTDQDEAIDREPHSDLLRTHMPNWHLRSLDPQETEPTFDERARNDVYAFKQRYRYKGTPVVSEENEWAGPSDDTMVRKPAWDNFVTELTTDMHESPV